ncbi:MAG: AAA family ATPase [Myxococcales bacterium]|nr:AAA family ATPase [Myxococcales bacterium]
MTSPRHLAPRPLDARRAASIVDVTPTAAQRRAIEAPAGRPMLVLGDAGHGKTTLALLRLAALAERATGRFRARVIVPEEGLQHLVDDALFQLGLSRTVARAETYDRWALREARRAFPDLPRRVGTDATPAVARLKRDPALEGPIAEVAGRPPGRIDEDADREGPEGRDAHAQWGDLQHLFGDRALLAAVLAGAHGRVPAHALDETLLHTRIQFSARTEAAFAHVTDARRLRALDGETLDAGTPTADAGTLDAEDAAVMFLLDALRTARLGADPERPRPLDCLVLDEAQELAPIELRLLGRALRPGGTLIVAGDADQQIDRTTSFPGWDECLALLGAPDHDRVRLDHGFRCPGPVVALARAVRDGVVPEERWKGIAFAGEAFAPWLDQELAHLREEDPTATIAILARDATRLAAFASQLDTVIPTCREGRFPRRGPVLATVDQVRGLEFDFVVLPDVGDYDDTKASRRTLYVAMTRTRHQLVTESPLRR